MLTGSDTIAAARRDFEGMALGWRMIASNSAPSARAAAEVQVFNQMVVALQGRMPGLAELRLLAEGIAGDGRFPVSPGWRADASVTGYRAGDRIAVTEEVFSRLVGVVLDQAKRNAG